MNNVKIEALLQSKKAIVANPDLGLKKWKTRVDWVDGLKHDLNVRNFPSIQTDIGENLGGSDTAPTPIEHLLNAAGSCFAVTFQMLASQEKIEVNHFKLDIESDFSALPFLGISRDYAGIFNTVFTMNVKSNASIGKITEIASQALERSPVIDSLKNKPILQINL